MKLNCTIDGKKFSINCSSDKPLSKILSENIESFPANYQCHGAKCGNCLVLLNNNCVLACMIPAFKANGASILTYDGFSKTRFCHDVERAYLDSGNKPCEQCYASKTILIASLVEMIDRQKQTNHILKNVNQQSQKNDFDSEFIAKEMDLNSCKCMGINQIEKIIKLAIQYRSKRRGNVK